jgi:adenosylcobinamide-GDP ribazoletransferase
MSQFIRHFLLAVQFFTRIPITGRLADWVGYSPQMLRESAAHFPAIGILVGLVAAASFAVVAIFMPYTPATLWLAAMLSTVVTVMLTGAFHEDGLADVADGLGGAVERERALEIMKDSRLGTYGVLALLLALGVKVGALAVLGSQSLDLVCAALLGSHTVSRTLALGLIAVLPHVGDLAGSKSKPLADQISPLSLAVAALWMCVVLAFLIVALDGVDWLSPLLACALAWTLMWRLFARRLGGFTGDCLGATQQVCELAFYLGLAVSL